MEVPNSSQVNPLTLQLPKSCSPFSVNLTIDHDSISQPLLMTQIHGEYITLYLTFIKLQSLGICCVWHEG